MAFTKAGKIKQYKQACKLEREEKAVLALAKDNSSKREKPNRKMVYEEIVKTIPKNLYDPELFIRNPEDWVAKSYNKDRQKIDFIKWIYCKYHVPQFMFSIFDYAEFKIEAKRYSRNYARSIKFSRDYLILFFDWFLTITRGESFYKKYNEFFTRKEAHIFANLKNNKGVLENYWLSKCKAVELNDSLTDKIINVLSAEADYILNSVLQELIKFTKKHEKDINKDDFQEILDYIIWKLQDKTFSLKGRSVSSLVKLSNEWHKDLQKRKLGNSNLNWIGLNIPDWTYKEKVNDGEREWEIIQLLSSKELYKEGKAMKHCVALYSTNCANGNTFIFSMTRKDIGRIATIEVSKYKAITQVRGPLNKIITGHPDNIIAKWANINGIAKR